MVNETIAIVLKEEGRKVMIEPRSMESLALVLKTSAVKGHSSYGQVSEKRRRRELSKPVKKYLSIPRHSPEYE